MEKTERITSLKELVPTEEIKLLNYKGVKDLYPVYEIPLEYLIYNPYNGRVRSITKSWEATNHKLNPNSNEDKTIIEQFLWNSSERNKQTKASISEYGQIEVGIVTQDGMIIDGNRRACIINILNREESENLKFRAIILPDELQDNEREIVQLETVYQMGVDNKVDYNPIEKYLRCKELIDLGFNLNELSKMLSVSTNEISKWLDTLELMHKYLDNYGYDNIYVGLEKREGHFVDLRQYLKSYVNGVGKDYSNWDYGNADLEKLQLTYFDYTRIRYPVQNCRIIANPSKAQSFFCHEEIWSEFIVNHNQIVSNIRDLELEAFISDSNKSNIKDIIHDRDELWRREVKDNLVDNLYTSKRILEDKLKHDEPLKKLKSASGTISSITLEDVTSKKSSNIDLLSNDIIERLEQIKTANNL